MEPLVPAEVDLRGLPYMPLDVNRLRDSQLAISASGDEFRAAVLLWCASWNQVPAASLPADDATLAAYAGYGRDVKGWRKVKDGAMRGFVHCSDGRWYHPVVAEKALEAWRERLDYRDKKGNEAERLQRYRDEHRQIRDRLREYGITAPWNAKIEDLRATLQEHELKHSVDEPATRTGALQERNGKRCSTEPETHTGALPATAKKGREGKGREGIEELKALEGINTLLSKTRVFDVAGPEPESWQDPPTDQPDETDPVDDAGAGKAHRLPPCPHDRILDLFAVKLPELPQPRRSLWADSASARALAHRWRWVLTATHETGPRKGQRLATDADEAVAWFGRMFDYVRTCPLLMGERGTWQADLHWLVKPANFAKVLDGNYESREVAA